jgi:Tfp pilus assembly protein PilO
MEKKSEKNTNVKSAEESKTASVGSKETLEAEKQSGDDEKAIQTKVMEDKDPVKKKKKLISASLFVTILNVVLIILTFLVLTVVPKKSDELKTIKNEQLDAQLSSNVQVSDLEIGSIAEKVDKLNSIFPDDVGIVNFVKEIEKLKTGGIVKGISFVNQEAVMDKRTNSLGTPFVIEMEGAWADIDTSLNTIEKLPDLFRVVTIEAKVNEEGVVNFKYGGFLYVDETFAKSR